MNDNPPFEQPKISDWFVPGRPVYPGHPYTVAYYYWKTGIFPACCPTSEKVAREIIEGLYNRSLSLETAYELGVTTWRRYQEGLNCLSYSEGAKEAKASRWVAFAFRYENFTPEQREAWETRMDIIVNLPKVSENSEEA